MDVNPCKVKIELDDGEISIKSEALDVNQYELFSEIKHELSDEVSVKHEFLDVDYNYYESFVQDVPVPEEDYTHFKRVKNDNREDIMLARIQSSRYPLVLLHKLDSNKDFGSLSVMQKYSAKNEMESTGIYSDGNTRNTDEKRNLKCSTNESSKRYLSRSLRSQTEDRPFKCETCTYATSYQHALEMHLQTHDEEFLKNAYKCTRCLDNSSEDCLHAAAIMSKKDYFDFVEFVEVPLECGKYAKKRKSITRHNHRRAKGFLRCSECSYSSLSKGNFDRHLRCHTGERPYKCKTCPYTASDSGTIIKHELLHTGIRPHKCDHCSYTASRKHTLLKHIQVHTGEKPFKCMQCLYTTSRRYSLKLHLRSCLGKHHKKVYRKRMNRFKKEKLT